ncbi:MAG: NAD(P)H-hydrate dehydratase [Clostridiales bacterium]|nr:NAD(P)H-hydrate dehydratase [Clostridiales bacterium]
MLHTISPQDMQEMERAFLDGTQYPSILLMEHAAQAVVDCVERYAPKGGRVLFICGGGNNGGDGCAAARIWMQRGGKADVWLLSSPAKMKGDAGTNACLLNVCGANMTILYGEAPEIPADCAAVVDALFGTGLSRALEGAALSAVQRMNESGLPVIAVDIPSGVDGATGQALGEAVHAASTVTFHRPKHGHLLFPGRALAGELIVSDIGILPEWDGAQGIEVLEREDARALLPIRARDAHKGTFGHVLLIAGSEGMAGAACLSAQAALRSGAGLVTAACCAPVRLTMQNLVPCAMAKVVCTGSALDAGAAMELYRLAQGKRALAIGPGIGTDEGAWRAISQLVVSDIPKVIDADALNLLARHKAKVGANTVLTPHPGEMARMCGAEVEEIVASPVEYAQQLSQDMDCCVLLKGATTVIARGEDVAMNVTGCDAMGTGGCGDVLTGVIAALMAQGMTPYDAARAGAYYHGIAGEDASKKHGSRAVTAWDVCDMLRIE